MESSHPSQLSKNILNMDNLKIARFFIKILQRQLEILTSEDWKIYLDRDKDIKNQMEILGKVLREKITLSERRIWNILT